MAYIIGSPIMEQLSAPVGQETEVTTGKVIKAVAVIAGAAILLNMLTNRAARAAAGVYA